MSLTVDGNAKFGTGPHTVVEGGVDRICVEGRFPGRVGVKMLALNGDRKEIEISGELVGSGSSAALAAASLASLVTGLDALVQDGNHTIVDAYSKTWTGVMMHSWKPTGPRKGPTQIGSLFYVTQGYTSRWVQNDFSVTS